MSLFKSFFDLIKKLIEKCDPEKLQKGLIEKNSMPVFSGNNTLESILLSLDDALAKRNSEKIKLWHLLINQIAEKCHLDDIAQQLREKVLLINEHFINKNDFYSLINEVCVSIEKKADVHSLLVLANSTLEKSDPRTLVFSLRSLIDMFGDHYHSLLKDASNIQKLIKIINTFFEKSNSTTLRKMIEDIIVKLAYQCKNLNIGYLEYYDGYCYEEGYYRIRYSEAERLAITNHLFFALAYTKTAQITEETKKKILGIKDVAREYLKEYLNTFLTNPNTKAEFANIVRDNETLLSALIDCQTGRFKTETSTTRLFVNNLLSPPVTTSRVSWFGRKKSLTSNVEGVAQEMHCCVHD